MKFPDTIIYRLHAVRRMFERDISEEAIQAVLKEGLIIYDYKDDKPYPSYLIAGKHKNRFIHVVVSVNNDEQTTIVITAYLPELTEWEPGFLVRRKK